MRPSWMNESEFDYGREEPVVFDVGKRASGKTTRLLDWLNAAPEGETRIFVTFSVAAARNAWEWSKRDGAVLEKWQFQTFDRIRNGALEGRPGRIVLGIDNVEYVLRRVFGCEVARVSATGVSERHRRLTRR